MGILWDIFRYRRSPMLFISQDSIIDFAGELIAKWTIRGLWIYNVNTPFRNLQVFVFTV